MAATKTDLERAWDALVAKGPVYDQYFNYYDGDQPLMYSSKRLKDIFAGLEDPFVENWTAVVIDALKDRINLSGIQTTSTKLADFFNASQVKLESDDLHEAALITGEAFYIIWPDEDGTPEGYYNDPRLVHLFYRSDKPREILFGAKWWVDESDARRYMTLYYPDRLEYYKSNKAAKQIENPKSMIKSGDADNPYGQVPIFHFKPEGRKIKSDIKNAIPLQNGINKLLTDMMVAAEFGAFRQRWVITDADIQGKLKNAPNEIWKVPAGDGVGQGSSVGEFSPNDLGNYLKAINDLALAISTITRTPKHYFLSTGGSDPSGEALMTMESPLNKKATDRIDRFIPTWQAAFSFAARVAGEVIPPEDILVQFDRPETIQPRTQAEIREINKRAGIPLPVTLAEEGKTQVEIDEILKAIKKELADAQAGLAAAVLEARRNFDSGGTEE